MCTLLCARYRQAVHPNNETVGAGRNSSPAVFRRETLARTDDVEPSGDAAGPQEKRVLRVYGRCLRAQCLCGGGTGAALATHRADTLAQLVTINQAPGAYRANGSLVGKMAR